MKPCEGCGRKTLLFWSPVVDRSLCIDCFVPALNSAR